MCRPYRCAGLVTLKLRQCRSGFRRSRCERKRSEQCGSFKPEHCLSAASLFGFRSAANERRLSPATRTKAAAQPQSQRTKAAAQPQSQRTKAAAQPRSQRTKAAAQPQFQRKKGEHAALKSQCCSSLPLLFTSQFLPIFGWRPNTVCRQSRCRLRYSPALPAAGSGSGSCRRSDR